MDVRLLAAVSGELEGLNVAALCRERGVSRKTFYKWRARYLAEGVAGLEAQSRRPKSSPSRMPEHVEEAIIACRKRLLDYGLDAGAATIRWHLRHKTRPLPSEATIWRVLVRRGFVVPEPRKRPKRSFVRFEADRPNECWQIDASEWRLADLTRVELLNVIDDHSRLAIASRAVLHATTDEAWATFDAGISRYGLPTRCLSDNGLAFSGRLRGMEVGFETQLRSLGIQAITARPFHPQTCGKVERFQQTLKRWLRARPLAETVEHLQAQLDEFTDHYNHQRPHRAIGRITPYERWSSGTTHAGPRDRQRPDRLLRTVKPSGVVQVNRWLIALGVDYAGQPAEIITDGTRAAVFVNGSLVRDLTIDQTRPYQPSGKRRGPKRKDGT